MSFYACRRCVLLIKTVNSCENEAPDMWDSCCPRMGCTEPPTSRTRFGRPEISAARRAHIARYENRVDAMRKVRRWSVCNGRCCRPQIVEISIYSKLGRGFPTWGVEHESSQNPTSQAEFEIGSISCPSYTVNSACVSVRRRLANGCWRVSRKRISAAAISNILHSRCRYPRFEVTTVIFPANEIF